MSAAPYVPFAIAIAAGYFLGALPIGYLVAKRHGVDIFTVGSRNPGATNVKRVVGKGAGNLVFVLDFMKGAIATAWVHFIAGAEPATPAWLGLTGLTAAILGHSFSIFTRFRGGKGVATALGGAAALMPVAAITGALVWLALFYSTRYVSVASMAMAVALPVVAYFFPGDRVVFVFAAILAVFVIVRHRENIQRLLHGTENRFPPKKVRTTVEGRGHP